MKIKREMEIRPFNVPFKIWTNDDIELRVSDLDFLELGQMCDEFRKSIFEIAGLEDKRK